MESENIAIVRRMHELFNALDPDPKVRASSPATAELLALFASDVEFVQPPGALDSSEHEGRAAFEDSWVRWLEMWESLKAEITEIDERGQTVLALTRNSFVGRDGVTAELEGGGIYRIAGGRIVSMRAFFDAAEARRAFEEETDAG